MLPKAQYYIAFAYFALLLIGHSDGAYRSAIMTKASLVKSDMKSITTRQVHLPTNSRAECAVQCLNDGSCLTFLYEQKGTTHFCSILHDPLPTNKVSHLNQEYYVYRERTCRRAGFTFMQHESLCYLVDYTWMNHAASLQFCKDRQSHLFRVDSRKKQECLEKIVKSTKKWNRGRPVHHVYIDGKQKDRKWYFSNGKQLKHFFWVNDRPRTDPRNSCIITSHSLEYKWEARPCRQFGETARICEKELM